MFYWSNNDGNLPGYHVDWDSLHGNDERKLMSPNWASNRLMISGPDEHIKKFLESVQNEEGEITFCEHLLPLPDESKESGLKWYEDALEMWGTKWGDCDTEILDEFTDRLTLQYLSAWSPPLAALQTISKMFPTLSFYTEYREEGMGFSGHYHVQNGVEISQKETSWLE